MLTIKILSTINSRQYLIISYIIYILSTINSLKKNYSVKTIFNNNSNNNNIYFLKIQYILLITMLTIKILFTINSL